ncbi:MAG: hypothetical protein R2770_12430 [Acidimicrobiales bacterium]|nr:hypothetical protein [Acidimicrobiales bacterium]
MEGAVELGAARWAQPSLFDDQTSAPELDGCTWRQPQSFQARTLFSERADAEEEHMSSDPQPQNEVNETPNRFPWVGESKGRHSELLEVDESSPLLARAFRASRAG